MEPKLLFLFLGLTTLTTVSIDVATVRNDYQMANGNEQAVKELHYKLMAIGKQDDAVLIAYKGAVTTMMAEYAEGFKDKKMLFKEGRELLEYAIERNPENIEIRCIRLSVQENVPKITGYTKHKEQDKKFILDHFAAMEDQGAKEFVKGFAVQSNSFTETERESF